MSVCLVLISEIWARLTNLIKQNTRIYFKNSLEIGENVLSKRTFDMWVNINVTKADNLIIPKEINYEVHTKVITDSSYQVGNS